MNTKRTLASICLSCFAIYGSYSTAYAEDLTSIFKMAMTANPSISLAEEQVSEGKAAEINAFMGYLPEVSVTYDHDRTDQKIVRSDNTVFAVGKGSYKNYQETFQLTQNVFNFESIMDVVAADMNRERLKAALVSTRQDLGYQAIEAYLNTLAAADDARLARIEKASMEKRKVEAETREKQGLATSYEIDQVDARLAEANARFIATRTSYQRAFAALEKQVGQMPADLKTLGRDLTLPRLDNLDPEFWLEAALKSSPKIRSLNMTIDQRRAALAADVGQALPKVQFLLTHTIRDSGGSLFGGGSKTREGVAMMRVTVPIFNPGGRGYEALQTRSQVEQAHYQRAAYLRELRSIVSSAVRELQNGPERIKALVNSVNSHRRLVDSSKIKFDAGQLTMIDLIDEDEDLYTSERQALAAIYSHLLNYALIHQVTGTLDQAAIVTINELLDEAMPRLTPVSDFAQYDGAETDSIVVQ